MQKKHARQARYTRRAWSLHGIARDVSASQETIWGAVAASMATSTLVETVASVPAETQRAPPLSLAFRLPKCLHTPRAWSRHTGHCALTPGPHESSAVHLYKIWLAHIQ
eukprot:4771423-Pleurochrysis_carterae.AAC.1